jgi:pyruvate formate lyase activating enzyme
VVKAPPLWRQAPDGRVDRTRHAEHWHREGGGVRCDLCYRKCALGDGETGWCGFRSARDGRMVLDSHGIVSSVVRQARGYGPDPFLTYKPGQTSVFLGGQQCTAACTFCMSTQVVHDPGKVPWAGGREQMVPSDSLLYGTRALMHPSDAVAAAVHHQAASVLFGINEPTLSFEWTIDVAQLARRRGLDVAVETNGFTEPGPLRQLARFTSAVDVGVKGSLHPGFYERVMRSPGAPEAVRRALAAWQRAGVHLVVGDLIAPPFMQPDGVFTEAAKSFYGWIADTLGEHALVLITAIYEPGPMKGKPAAMLERTPGGAAAYRDRLEEALALARAAGLPYAHHKSPDEPVRCHACGGVLLRFWENCTAGWHASGVTPDRPCVMPRSYCPWWSHEQHVTPGGLCGHCGTAVPVVCLGPAELAAERAKVTAAAAAAGLVSG